MPCKFGHNHVHVRQVTGQTCSTACVEMVCRKAGAQLEYTNFQQNFYDAFSRGLTTPGLTHIQIEGILRGLGFGGEVLPDRSFENVGTLLRGAEAPTIAEVAVSLRAGAGMHWVVVDGRTSHKFSTDEFCILDPSQAGVICASLSKTGHASYLIGDGRHLLFTGRMIRGIGRLW